MENQRKCHVADCESTNLIARGLCHSHYDKWRRNEEAMVKVMGGRFVAIRSISALRKRVIKNVKAAVKSEETIAPGSTVLKKLVDKAKAAKAARADGGTDKLRLSVEPAPDPNGRAKMLADEHWAYVWSLLVTHGDDGDPDELTKIEFHYKSAAIHFYKHGMADRERVIQG